MFWVFHSNQYGDEFRGEGETLQEAYKDLEDVWGESLPTEGLRWYRVEPIKVTPETRFILEE